MLHSAFTLKTCSNGSPGLRLPQLEAYRRHLSNTEVHNTRRLSFTLLTHRQYEMFGYKIISCSTSVSFTSDVQNGLQVAQSSERTLQIVFSYKLQNAKPPNTKSWNACCGLYHVPPSNPVHGTRDHSFVAFFFFILPALRTEPITVMYKENVLFPALSSTSKPSTSI